MRRRVVDSNVDRSQSAKRSPWVRRLITPTLLALAFAVCSAGMASASTLVGGALTDSTVAGDSIVDGRLDWSVAGQVGVAAIALGIGGMVLGFIRHRKRRASTASRSIAGDRIDDRDRINAAT